MNFYEIEENSREERRIEFKAVFNRRLNPPQGSIAFLAGRNGDTMLELIQMEKTENVSASGPVLSFLAGRPLTLLHEKAEKMGYPVSKIVSVPPKPAHFSVTDPDGLAVEISEA